MTTIKEEKIIYYTNDVKIVKLTKNAKSLCVKSYLNTESRVNRELYENEIYVNETLQRLKHKNITRYYGRRGLNLIFEYSSIGSLYDYRLRNEEIEGKFLSRLINGIVNGLKAMHQVGYVHNDIKMSNILLFKDKKGELYPKLCDFNVSHRAAIRPSQQVVDEPDDDILNLKIDIDYTSLPDQCIRLFPTSKYNIDISSISTPSSDYYDLGIMLYELIFGEKPFTDDENYYMTVANKTYANREYYKRCHNETLKDLLEKLITTEENRLNDDNILDHPYFKRPHDY
jgi:serine/threonine-protein kinase 11